MTINWNLPTNWNEVTLATYKRLEKAYKQDSYTAKDVLLALDNTKTMDDINLLTVEVLEKLLSTIDFIVSTPCPHGEATNKIEIDGEVYICNIAEKMRTCEYVAADTAIKQEDYAGILAVLFRKNGELYDSQFENEVLPSRIELFNSQPITKILPLMDFFLHLWITSEGISQLSSMVKEEGERIACLISSTIKDGGLPRRYTKSLTKTLRSLQKSIKSMS